MKYSIAKEQLNDLEGFIHQWGETWGIEVSGNAYEQLEVFISTLIDKVREENTKEIQKKVLDLIFDTRNSQEYIRGFMSCKTYVDGLLFQYLQSIKEENETK